MAKLSERELADIRRAHGIRPEHIGPLPQDKRQKPSGRRGQEAPEWLTERF